MWSRIYGLWIFNDNDNCNVNDNGISNTTAERLFEALRIYYSVILSTDQGLVVLGFCKGKEELRGAAVYWAFLLWIEVLV